MGFFTGKSRVEYTVAGIFFVFVVLFSFARTPIAEVGAWMLALSRELKTTEEDTEGDSVELAEKPEPQIRNLPKTEQPVVLFSNDPPSWQDTVFATFPKLRNHNGDPWGNEDTEIRACTNGRKLFVMARLYDQDPDSAITRHSQTQSSLAWRDDSIELFLMRDNKTDIYCQYALSVSGIGHDYYLKGTDNPSSFATVEMPKDFTPPIFESRKLENRFELEVIIDLQNIGIEDLKPGGSFLIQIVRNYRGQGESDSVTLQLFPTHIYADKRFSILNHDRRAFQPVKIVESTIYSSLSHQEGESLLKLK